jgi:hypothetical protein
LQHLADSIASREQAADLPISRLIGSGIDLTQVKLAIAVVVYIYRPAKKALILLVELVAGNAGGLGVVILNTKLGPDNCGDTGETCSRDVLFLFAPSMGQIISSLAGSCGIKI